MKSLSKTHGVLGLRCPEVLLRTVIRSQLELRLKISIRDVHIYLHPLLFGVFGLSLDQSLHFFNGLFEFSLDEGSQVIHHDHFSLRGDGVLPDLSVQLSFEGLNFLQTIRYFPVHLFLEYLEHLAVLDRIFILPEFCLALLHLLHLQLVGRSPILEGGYDLLLFICVFERRGLGEEDVVPQLHPAGRAGVLHLFIASGGYGRAGDLVLFVQLLREGQFLQVVGVTAGCEDVDGQFCLRVVRLVLLLLLAHGNMRFHVMMAIQQKKRALRKEVVRGEREEIHDQACCSSREMTISPNCSGFSWVSTTSPRCTSHSRFWKISQAGFLVRWRRAERVSSCWSSKMLASMCSWKRDSEGSKEVLAAGAQSVGSEKSVFSGTKECSSGARCSPPPAFFLPIRCSLARLLLLKMRISSSSALLSSLASNSRYLAWSSSCLCLCWTASRVMSSLSGLSVVAVQSRFIFSSNFSAFRRVVLLAAELLRARRTVRFSAQKLKDWPMMSTFLLRLAIAPKRMEELVELDWLESSCSGFVGSPSTKPKFWPISVRAWLKSVQGCSRPELGLLPFELSSSLRAAPRSRNSCGLGGRILTGLLMDQPATSPRLTFLVLRLLTGLSWSSSSSFLLLVLTTFSLNISPRQWLSERWKAKYFQWSILASMSTSSPFSLICLRRGSWLAAFQIS